MLDTESAFGVCRINEQMSKHVVYFYKKKSHPTNQRAQQYLQPHSGDLGPEFTEVEPSPRGFHGCIGGIRCPSQSPVARVLQQQDQWLPMYRVIFSLGAFLESRRACGVPCRHNGVCECSLGPAQVLLHAQRVR